MARSTGSKPLKRVIAGVLGLIVLAFAVEGGEYGTTDLLRQRARKDRLRRSIDSLRAEVDSLTTMRRAIASDPAVQERIAREEFGMVRGTRELLYRFADLDTVARRDNAP